MNSADSLLLRRSQCLLFALRSRGRRARMRSVRGFAAADLELRSKGCQRMMAETRWTCSTDSLRCSTTRRTVSRSNHANCGAIGGAANALSLSARPPHSMSMELRTASLDFHGHCCDLAARAVFASITGDALCVAQLNALMTGYATTSATRSASRSSPRTATAPMWRCSTTRWRSTSYPAHARRARRSRWVVWDIRSFVAQQAGRAAAQRAVAHGLAVHRWTFYVKSVQYGRGAEAVYGHAHGK